MLTTTWRFVLSQRTYATYIIEEETLVVSERPESSSHNGDDAFSLQDELDNAFLRGVNSLIFEVEEYTFATKLNIGRSLNVSSRLPGSARTELKCAATDQLLNIKKDGQEEVQVVLKNLKISDCVTSSPQGIVHIGNDTQVQFENVELTNNTATGENDTAIVVAGSETEVEVRGNSSFSKNQGRVFLIGSKSGVRFEKSSFLNNIATTYGSVLATRANDNGISLTVTGSKFVGNIAEESNGGVFYLERSSITLRNGVEFISNTATHQGGAIFLKDFIGIDISDSLFDGNSCHMGRGGALYISPSNGSACGIQRSVFVRNFANGVTGLGGAIAFIDTTLQNNARLDLAPDVLFLKNTARVSGGAALVNGTNTTVEISSIFIGNEAQSQGGGVSIIPSEHRDTGENFIVVIVKEASFTRNYGGRRGGGAISIYGRVNLTTLDSYYTNNTGIYGGAIYTERIAETSTIKNCTLTENTANETGGSIMIFGGKHVTIEDSTFVGDSCMVYGGSIYAELTREVNVYNSIFNRNTAKRGGGAINIGNNLKVRGQDTKLILLRCVFRWNKSPRGGSQGGFGGAVRLYGGGVHTTLSHCKFEFNEAQWGGSINLAETYVTTLSNSNFSNNSASLGGAIYIVPLERSVNGKYDVTTIEECQLIQNKAAKGGAIFARPDRPLSEEIIDSSSSLLRISQSLFLKNRASNIGGAIFLSGINATFFSCSFRNNLVTYEIEGSSNYDPNTMFHSGGGMYVSDGSYVNVSETTFEANEAVRHGAGICIVDAFVNCIRKCEFLKNVAQNNGGGIYCSISSRKLNSKLLALYHCRSCKFVSNQAQRGGGIYTSLPRIDQMPIEIQNNQSVGNGITGYSESENRQNVFVYLQNMKMNNNSGSVTGNAIFSTQPSLIIIHEGDQKMNLIDYVNRTQNIDTTGNEYSSTVHNVKAKIKSLPDLNRGETGVELENLSFEILDYFGQQAKGLRIVADLRVCQNASECCKSSRELSNNNNNSFLLSGESTRIADHGTVNFRGVQISDYKTGKSKLDLAVCFEDNGDDPVEINDHNVQISFKGCYQTEKQDLETGRCSNCSFGQYLMQNTNTCDACPEHASCEGITITPDNGYWHATSVSNKTFSCHPREACTPDKQHLQGQATLVHRQGTILNWTDDNYDQCGKGYEGILCRSCEKEYGHWNHFCVRCYNEVLIWLSLLGSFVWNLLVLLIFVYSARTLVDRLRFNQRNTAEEVEAALYAPWSRELRPYQIMWQLSDTFVMSEHPFEPPASSSGNLVTDVSSETPLARHLLRRERTREQINTEQLPLANPLSESLKIVLNFMQVIYLAALLSEDLPSFFKWSLIPFDSLNLTETAFLIVDCLLKGHDNRSIIRMTLQALFPLFLFLFICLLPILASIFIRNIKFGSKEVRLVAMCTVYLYFGPQIRTLLKFLDKVDMNDENIRLDTYRFWSIDTSVQFMKGAHALIVGLLVFPLLFSLTIGYPSILFILLKKQKDHLNDVEVVSSSGFLYKGYDEKYYYWETIILIRKTILAVISVFAENVELQSVFMSITLVFFLSLQLLLQPFTSSFPCLNRLEALSLGVSTLMFSGVSLMLRCNELNKDMLQLIIAWFLFLILLITLFIMSIGVYSGIVGFLNDKLIEKRVYLEKQSLESVSVGLKIYKLMRCYYHDFRARLIGARFTHATEMELPQVQ
eukprot:g93.t1